MRKAMMSRKNSPAAVIGLAVISITTSWLADAAPANYPSKPVRLIAANSAGGGLDIVARSIAPKLAAVFGYQVV
ncbi:MAG: tripartite tricarboxylate transporter substrate binding protein, partial [Burkholderiales bacterium]